MLRKPKIRTPVQFWVSWQDSCHKRYPFWIPKLIVSTACFIWQIDWRTYSILYDSWFRGRIISKFLFFTIILNLSIFVPNEMQKYSMVQILKFAPGDCCSWCFFHAMTKENHCQRERYQSGNPLSSVLWQSKSNQSESQNHKNLFLIVYQQYCMFV